MYNPKNFLRLREVRQISNFDNKVNGASNVKSFIFTNIKIIPFLLIFFGYLDYYTLISVFHLKNSSFLDIYLFNTNLTSPLLLIGVVLLPLFFILSFFSISYFNVYVPYMMNKSKTKDFLNICINFKNSNYYLVSLYISIIHTSITIFLIILLLEIIKLLGTFSLFEYIGLIIIIPIIANLSIMQSLIVCNQSNKRFVSSYTLISLFVSIIIYAGYIYFSKDMNILFITISIMSLNFYSLQFIETILTISRKKISFFEKFKDNKANIAVIIVILTILTILLNHINEKTWKEDKKSLWSISLFMNKMFLSGNSKNIDLNITNLNNQDINLTKIYSLGIVKLDANTTYLPISKEMKLYFKENNETNQTIVFAVEKHSYKGKYFYSPIDIGYIDNK